MKQLILILSVLLLTTTSCKEEIEVPADSFRIYGTIEGLDTSYMSWGRKDKSGKRYSDSIFVKNGKFDFTAKIDKLTHISLWPNVEKTIKRAKSGGYYPVKSSQLAFFASPGQTIQFEGKVTDFIDVYPKGNQENNELASINSEIFPLMNKSVNLLLDKQRNQGNEEELKRIEDGIALLDKEVIAYKKKFIENNPQSKAAIWYLSDMMMRRQISDTDAIKNFNNADLSLNETSYYQDVKTRIQGVESSKIGTVLANFSKMNVMNQEQFELSSTRGKYVLIDFWGTWCGPCVKEMPTVKAYQEKYKDQLVVIGINSGDSEEKLKSFVHKNEYDWAQVMVENNDLVLALNVTGFPTKFILDLDGKIVFRLLGDGHESFEKLDELLGKS